MARPPRTFDFPCIGAMQARWPRDLPNITMAETRESLAGMVDDASTLGVREAQEALSNLFSKSTRLPSYLSFPLYRRGRRLLFKALHDHKPPPIRFEYLDPDLGYRKIDATATQDEDKLNPCELTRPHGITRDEITYARITFENDPWNTNAVAIALDPILRKLRTAGAGPDFIGQFLNENYVGHGHTPTSIQMIEKHLKRRAAGLPPEDETLH